MTVERRPQIRSDIAGFVADELDQFDRGEIARISTPTQLRDQFGFTRTPDVYLPLRGSGLVQRRRVVLASMAEREIASFIQPSPEWAWMLAVLSLGGSVTRGGKIRLTHSREPELKDKFILLGENLFNRNARVQPYKWSNGHEGKAIEFSNLTATRAIGDLGDERFIDTINNTHGWILEEPQFTWRFLEGLFDVRGYASTETSRYGIQLMTVSVAIANFIISSLAKVGIEHVDYKRRKKLREGIMGIRITRLPEAILFAQQIHSVIPEKEEHLEIYRQKQPSRTYRVITDEELIAEWQRMKEMLGRAPSYRDVLDLKKSHKTEYYPLTYNRHFGGIEVNGVRVRDSFRLAKANIEMYIANRDEE